VQKLVIWDIDPDHAEEVTPEVVLDALEKLAVYVNKTDNDNFHGAAKALSMDV
jgi:hypothetical protein